MLENEEITNKVGGFACVRVILCGGRCFYAFWLSCIFPQQITLPYFWIWANFVTFLVPPEYRIISAAFMSICLGGILSSANKLKARQKGVPA
ncbi:Mpv17/PMP22 family protein [Desulfitobacterium sp. THU1]|uniref:Mpv17/PMP22 family protein n=1 Tax=Desulfitobacterium sp. THU1 TaxID=3138072 RepID=UPI00311E1E45